ncbi:MAG: hypothetical protein LPK88_14415, partial [Alphaproteobacteria bacterium]|nr:hypothetical protein [Alphaproteobacteria bacterium]MDX5417499.1 hypothetical protein [Alphaproteobacteria bacterium]MDX5494976.1 hypothetical protein [Alphaproteobacteria bacterium]
MPERKSPTGNPVGLFFLSADRKQDGPAETKSETKKAHRTSGGLFQSGCGGPQPTILAVDGTEDSKNAN